MKIETLPITALTPATLWGYAARATSAEVAGIDVPDTAAKSRQHRAARLFSCLCASSYGRPGGESRKARRCRAGTSISVRSLTRLTSGERFKTVHGIRTMKTQSQSAFAPTVLFTARESAILCRALRLLEAKSLRAGPVFTSPETVSAYLRLRFSGLPHEELHGLFLDGGHRLIQAECLAAGTPEQVQVSPRRIAHRALELGAAAVILAHNHPSHRACPSEGDLWHHKATKKALQTLEIRLLDNFVVTAKETVSIATHLEDLGRMEETARKAQAETKRAARRRKPAPPADRAGTKPVFHAQEVCHV